jgi:AraC family transcriptional regulator
MSRNSVPVTMGSPRFATVEARDCLVTVAWFPPGAVLEAHVHDRPTFATILDGGFDLAFTSPGIRRSSFECPPGTIFTEPAGEKHANYVAPDGAQVVVLQPDVGASELPARCLAMLDRINHFRDGPITTAARRLAREVMAPDDVTPLAIDALALEMLAEASRLDDRRSLGGSELPTWLRSTTELIHDRFRESLRIEDFAEAAEVHPAHLASVFRRVHRMPLAAYIRRLRLDWAAERLIRTNQPISMIAAEAGFADQAHMTRWFRRVMGATPAAYRNARRR